MGTATIWLALDFSLATNFTQKIKSKYVQVYGNKFLKYKGSKRMSSKFKTKGIAEKSLNKSI